MTIYLSILNIFAMFFLYLKIQFSSSAYKFTSCFSIFFHFIWICTRLTFFGRLRTLFSKQAISSKCSLDDGSR